MKPLKTLLILIVPYFAILSGCINQQSKNTNWRLSKIPTAEEVGAHAILEEIAPVKAPFPTINFEKPQFPADTTLLTLSKQSVNTKAIQQAIDELSAKGGGTVLVPAGEWFTGRIQLKDNINLHFADSAVLKFSGEIKDYLPAVFTRYAGVELMSLGACIYANNATNIAITGKGRLIGPGKSPVRDHHQGNELMNEIDPATPVSKRIYDGLSEPYIFRPMFIAPINCSMVYIEGISLEKTAFWNIVPIYCNNIIIRGVTINSIGIPSGDGINMESSKNALIEYCTLSCGDDCFTMKAGRGEDGMRVNRPTENVVVRHCLTQAGHGGVTCGSETAGMIRNLYVHDCVFNNTIFTIRFKTRRPRGGGGENLFYERIRLNAIKEAFAWDMLGSRIYVGELADRLPVRPINRLTPRYENIHAKDIIVESARYFIKVQGIPESPLKNVTIENCDVKSSYLFYAHDLKNSSFRNINITSNDSIIALLDSKNILFQNIEFNSNANTVFLDIQGSASDSIFVNSCLNIENIQFFAED